MRTLAVSRMRCRSIHDERTEELVELGARAPRGYLVLTVTSNKEGSISQDIKNNGVIPFWPKTLFRNPGKFINLFQIK